MSNAPSDEDDRTVIRPSGFHSTQSAGLPSASAGADSVLPSVTGPATVAPTAASSAGDSGNALPIGTFLAEFELTHVLGEGGFGIVYQAWDHSLERKVALKEYMPSSLAARSGGATVQVKSERHRETFEAGRKSFVNEAKLLAQFDHPALVKVYRFWEANGTAYMVMPLYEGVTLKDWLKGLTEAPDEAWLLNMLEPLTAALNVIHTQSCFHRDIAPDNIILLGGNGARPLLLDFGAARRVIGDMTQALTVILKPGYAPVEQYAEAPHMKQGAWTDIYALAAAVHFALLGKTPPPSVSRMMGDTYVPLTTALAGRYSDAFLRAIDRALLVKPEERTQTIDELRADLGLPPAGSVPDTGPGSRFGDSRFADSRMGGDSRFADSRMGGDSRFNETRPGNSRFADSTLTASAGTPAKSRMPLIAAIAAVVVVGGGAAAWLLRPAPAPAPTTVASTAAATPAVQAPAPAPAPAPASIAAAPVPQHFDALQQFDAVVAAQSPGHQVIATPAKTSLRIGKDSLAFSITSAQAGYVSVLVLGPDGALIQLFPNKQAQNNRIAAGQTLKLPGASWPLDTTDPAGTESFLVIVSDQPRDYGVLSTSYADLFLNLPTGAQADALLSRWDRATPLLLGQGPGGCQGANCDAYGAAKFAVEVVK